MSVVRARAEALWQVVRPRWRATSIIVSLVAAGAMLVYRGLPLWWLGASLWVCAVVLLRESYREPLAELRASLERPRRVGPLSLTPSKHLLDALYLGALFWVASYMVRDLWVGVRPISHDHTVHFVKAWQLHEHFLSQGRLHGFSQLWFAGYPVNYSYPIGTDLFVNLVYVLGFGALTFAEAYGLAFGIFHALTGYAGYRFGKMVAGPHVGFITGFLMITDNSTFRFGGWAYTVEYGVWPQALSLAFALLALARLPALYQEKKLSHLGVFALWMGAAIVTHPIQLIFAGLVVMAAVLAALFEPAVKSAAGTFRLLFAYVLSTVVSMAWLLPFMSTRSQTTPMGVWWDSTFEMGKGLLNLNAFPGTIGYVLAFGVLGAAVMLRSRRFALSFTAFVALLVPAVSNSTFIDALHLPEVSSAFTKIQWLRMSTMAKPFWFAMAGYFAVAFVRRASALADDPRPLAHKGNALVRRVMLTLVVSLVTLPIVVPMGQSFFTANIAKAMQTEADRALDTDRTALVEWLKKNLPDDEGFYRVCVNTGHNHDLMDLATEIGKPTFKRGFTPAENFIYKVSIEDPKIMEAVNVRFMIAKKYMPKREYEQLASFGIYRVYRFKNWQPEPFVVRGEGHVKLTRFEDDVIELTADAAAKGLLRLNVSYFPRWRAYRNGERVSLWPTSLAEARSSTGFLTVHLAPGTYRFVFEPSFLDRAALWLSLGGLLFALALIGADRLLTRVALVRGFDAVTDGLGKLSSPSLAPLRGAALVVCVGAGVLAFIALAERTPKLALEQLGGAFVERVRFDFVEGLGQARAAIDYRSRRRACKRVYDRFVCRGEDGNLDNEKYIASTPAEIEEYRMVRCIRARPEDNAVVSIQYPRVPSGDAIVGYYGVERAGRLMRLTRPVDFSVYVDGKPAYVGATTSDNKMHWFSAPVGGPSRDVSVTFTVSARNVNKRYLCFYAQMADLGQDASLDKTHAPAHVSEDDDDDAP